MKTTTKSLYRRRVSYPARMLNGKLETDSSLVAQRFDGIKTRGFCCRIYAKNQAH